jgi:Cytochrome C oxidase, cbb3-type, subunit III
MQQQIHLQRSSRKRGCLIRVSSSTTVHDSRPLLLGFKLMIVAFRSARVALVHATCAKQKATIHSSSVTRASVFASNNLRWFARSFFCLILAFMSACIGQQPVQPTLSRADLFRLHCSSCHGDGSGDGHVAATLPVRPRNLRHPDWQSNVTDKHIYQVIRVGGASVKLSDKMPGFADKLTDEQIQSLVQYIRAMR